MRSGDYCKLLPLFRICFAKFGVDAIVNSRGKTLDKFASSLEYSEFLLVKKVKKLLTRGEGGFFRKAIKGSHVLSKEDLEKVRVLAATVTQLRFICFKEEKRPVTLAHLVARDGMHCPELMHIIGEKFSFDYKDPLGWTPIDIILDEGIRYKGRENVDISTALADEAKNGEDTIRRSLEIIIS